MADYTRLNLRRDVEDMAPRFGHGEHLESRFARRPLGLERQGLGYFRLAPGWRFPFGHRHAEQEEVYIVVSGSARMKIEDDLVELAELDAVRVAPAAVRGLEAGGDGCEVLVTGAPGMERDDTEIIPGWWAD